jgi:hypothetical protein
MERCDDKALTGAGFATPCEASGRHQGLPNSVWDSHALAAAAEGGRHASTRTRRK